MLLWNTIANSRNNKAIKPELPSMTLGLADCIDASIHRCFNGVLESRSAIIASVTKFKLRWVETQQKKDLY